MAAPSPRNAYYRAGKKSTGSLIGLGVCLVILPWAIFFLGGWQLFLYVSLGIVLTLLCFNQRELRRRIRDWMAVPRPTHWQNAFERARRARHSKTKNRGTRPVVSRHNMSELTPCEFEILSAVAVGYSDKEIAQHIKIGASTVEHYLDRITKLELSTREELVLFAENNLVPLKTMPKD